MSSAHALARGDVKAKDEWTIMIFFAGDPHLSPSMTAQLKALKDAGFQDKTNVLVHYDPNERGVGTTTFEINRERKAQIKSTGDKGTRIGDGKDPFVRNLLEDSISGGAPKSATAVEALRTFLRNGLKSHEAEHYVIFLVGHGVVVGNDFFLPDRQPESAITLKQLGDVLLEFKNGAKMFDGEVELIGLHSCSMSAIEVAYQLKGAARYLMATEGVSFVTSWPYRQFLKKMLNTIDLADKNDTKVDVDGLVKSLQQLGVHNTKDFMFSGLSADLCLCSLEPKRIDDLTDPVQKLAKALKDGLKDPRGLELITLAHLKAQSYWQETYTDLYDFCLCLEKQCYKEEKGNPILGAMAAACKAVKEKLEESPDGVVVQSDYFGPLFQYSHGLSIFFPWAEPVEDAPLTAGDDMLGRYQNYAFTTELKSDSWLSFLREYFKATRRDSRLKEDSPQVSRNGARANVAPTAAVNAVFVANGGNGGGNGGGGESLEPEKASPSLAPEKASPSLSMGCTCSVKNYPMEFLLSPRASQNPQPNGNGDMSESKWEASSPVATARVK